MRYGVRRLAALSLGAVIFTGTALVKAEDRAASPGPAQAAGQAVDRAVESLFAAPTEMKYFSPFEIMNPGHIRPDLPLEIGRWRDLRLDMGFQSVGRFQFLHQDNAFTGNTNLQGLNPGFQNPFANLTFMASIEDKLDVYFDLYIASRPHVNTMYAHEGYLLFKQLPTPLNHSPLGPAFDTINVKVGGFDIDFGDGNFRRSNNAFVTRNPLIGNPIVDPNVEEIGGEVFSVKGPVWWLVGAGSGTTTEHFDYGAGGSAHAKVWAYPCPDVRTSASFYWADDSGSPSAFEHSNLFAAVRSGGAYSALFGGGDSPGQILPQHGERVMAIQADLTWNHRPWELYANFGWTQDTNSNGPVPGSPAERWMYGTIQPVYHLTPALYVAGQYSFAVAQSISGLHTNGWADRIQFGGGYWLTQNILAKVEYVYEQYHNFEPADGVVSGVTAYRSPRFSGVVMEVSFSF